LRSPEIKLKLLRIIAFVLTGAKKNLAVWFCSLHRKNTIIYRATRAAVAFRHIESQQLKVIQLQLLQKLSVL
jgi:hypothetical protein